MTEHPTEHPGFGALLTRLLNHRGLGGQDLADRAGVGEGEVRAVLAGDDPGANLLRRLAPALGLHTVDLFVLARRAVPDDMAPLDAAAAPWVKSAVTAAVRLPATERRDLLRLVRSLPQEERHSRFAPRPVMPLAGGPGTWVVRMLQYRNLTWSGMAATLAFTTPTYLSAATYGVIGSGRKELTPRLVTDFAALLGIDARDLAALTDVVLREVPPSPTPHVVDAAALLWAARRLSAAQARHVCELARSLRKD
ncbi:helix-turn-helix transcriptional regulator [Streptomyces sviceus]|uniref:helix-turn-helix transcriptional regulator n=1 Tax=Streptomyces sviceus TaxID=285530 RepID=UPI003329C399